MPVPAAEDTMCQALGGCAGRAFVESSTRGEEEVRHLTPRSDLLEGGA
jgi:hypothetical protein